MPSSMAGRDLQSHAATIAEHLVDIGLNQRKTKRKYTGGWLIFAEPNREKYYLCVAHHNTPDSEIKAAIDTHCVPEFPFLPTIMSE